MENKIELPEYLIRSPHPITINLIGVGGTGSWVLGDLAALHQYLVATERPGLKVYAYDGDIVTEANLGRQNFTKADLGENKAIALIEKYNRFYGLDWVATGENYNPEQHKDRNIIISCVDTIKSRKEIIAEFKKEVHNPHYYETRKKFLMIDCGNGYDFGQVIITRFGKGDLTFDDHFPNEPEKVNEHSCSVLESLGKQNLFINKFIANLAVNWLYEGIRNTEQNNLGYFFNFNNLTPIIYE